MGKRWRKYSNGPYRLGQLNGRAVVTWRDVTGRHRVRLEATSELEGRSELDAFVRKRALLTAGSATTIAELYAAYQADREQDGKQAANFTESWKALRPRFGNLRPDDITADLCRQHTAERIAAGKSPGTVWTELTRLRSALNWAKKRRLIREVPYVWVPTKPPPRDRVLTQDEVLRLLDACVMPHVRLFVLLALTTGGRSAALLELEWSRVNFEAGTINLKRAEVVNPLTKKVRKGRAVVPMNGLARAALQEAKAAAISDHVIEWNGEPIAKIRKGFSEAVRRAGLGNDVTPHVLRHTAASWMEAAQIPMHQISRYLGHKDERTTRTIYAHTDPASLANASDVLDLNIIREAKKSR